MDLNNATRDERPAPDCCGEPKADSGRLRIDKILASSVVLVAIGYALAFVPAERLPAALHHYAMGCFEIINAMWWGLALGVVFVGLLAQVPRETVVRILGQGGSFSGLLRATAAGVLLDLCSHGILAVGVKLYERGASAGQMIAFLVASPWNSISLTLILTSLIGLSWTLLFIVLSLVVAITTGWMFEQFVRRGVLPPNPSSANLDLSDATSVPDLIRSIRINRHTLRKFFYDGFTGSRMVFRWALFGVVLASGIRAFLPVDLFQNWFGPTLIGLLATSVAATIIEVCSEGSVPIAADLFNRAAAPGNAFTFLMAGVATDYTEIMTIRDTARSWRLALFLPLLAVPQVLLLGAILNAASL